MAFVIAWSVMVFLMAFLLCRPLAFNWDKTLPGGHCAKEPGPFIATGVLDLVIDIMVLLLPLPLIWNLQVSLANKVALFSIFGVGIRCVSLILILSQVKYLNFYSTVRWS